MAQHYVVPDEMSGYGQANPIQQLLPGLLSQPGGLQQLLALLLPGALQQGYDGSLMGAVQSVMGAGPFAAGPGLLAHHGFVPQMAVRPLPGAAGGSCHPFPGFHPGPRPRELPLGFDSVAAVPNGGSAIITQRPQVAFQGKRLIIPTAVGTTAGGLGFLVNDIKVGKDSQLTATGPVPAAMFGETSVGVAMYIDPALIAQDISLNVSNIGTGGARFIASLIGDSCQA